MSTADEANTEAATRFSRAAGRSLMLWRLVLGLQAYIAHGSAAAEQGLARAARLAADEIRAHHDFGSPEQRDEALKEMPRTVAAATANAMGDARIAAAAACIIFAHSILDANIDEYCAVSVLMNSGDWRSLN